VSGGTPRRIISSAIRDLDVAASSLGLLAFRSDRTGAPEIWISTSDGASQKKVTSLNSRSGSPRWSPDGRRLVFDSRRENAASDIYLMDCDPEELQCSPPIPLTNHPGLDAIPNWSADGSSVYFASQRTGQMQVWRVPADGKIHEATQMTTRGGNFATESLTVDGCTTRGSTRTRQRVYGENEHLAIPHHLSMPMKPVRWFFHWSIGNGHVASLRI